MVEKPEIYRLPCVEEKIGPAADIIKSSSGFKQLRLMNYLKMLCQIGELNNGVLNIAYPKYTECLKKLLPKITNADSYALIERLSDFGFRFTGFNGKSFDKGIEYFSVSYEDNKNLIPALKDYCMTDSNDDEFRTCQYHLIAAPGSLPQPSWIYAMSRCITEEQRKFLLKFDDRMKEEGFKSADSLYGQFCVEYYLSKHFPLNKNKPFYVRCFAYQKQLYMILKIRNIYDYIGQIEALPERIKSLYRLNNCRKCIDDCGAHRAYTIDGEKYTACQCKYVTLREFNVVDIETYISFIKMETKR
jgi:hypothetical protein